MTAPRFVLVDTNVLLNLAFVGRLDLLGAFPELRFGTCPEVLAEVISLRERTLVDRALACGSLCEIALDDPGALALFADLLRIMGRGESACLASAVHYRAWVASDEKRAFRREAERLLGQGAILNTPGLLVLAIRRGLITLKDADEMKATLEKRRFRMTFGSFAEVVGP